jgi:tetratricopeptide (TPR) repeat protein
MPVDRKDQVVRVGGRRREEVLLRRARAAERAGDLAASVEERLAAAELLRGSGRGSALGEVLYEVAGTLLRDGRADQAVVALDEAEEVYEGCAERVADVQVRRAIGYGLAGAGASAVVDAQSAVLHHRGARRRRDLARALAVNADVLAAYGDPDLAVAAADLAVRSFLDRGPGGGPHREELRRALAVAVAVHGAHGREDLAGQAAAVARRIGGLVGPAGGMPMVLQGRAARLGMTVARALGVVRERLGREAPWVGDRPVVRPAVELALVVPLDRVGGAGADAGARLGRGLAGLATALLPLDGVGGARLGMESHALLAGASRLGSGLLRDQLPAFGPAWAAALLACSRQAEAEGDLALALDFASWGAVLADRLFPATLVDRDTGAVATEVLDHRARLTAALRAARR